MRPGRLIVTTALASTAVLVAGAATLAVAWPSTGEVEQHVAEATGGTFHKAVTTYGGNLFDPSRGVRYYVAKQPLSAAGQDWPWSTACEPGFRADEDEYAPQTYGRPSDLQTCTIRYVGIRVGHGWSGTGGFILSEQR